MVSPRTNLEQFLGITAPGQPETPGLSIDAARLLTGDPSPAAPGAGETQVGGPPSPMSDPVPPQNPIGSGTPSFDLPSPPSPSSVDPSASGGAGAGAAPEQVLSDPNHPANGDIVRDFWDRHGRAPTVTDLQMIHAIPMIEQQLGRPPMRIEVLQIIGQRRENPEAGPLQFEPDTPSIGTNPMEVTMGMAPTQPSAMGTPPEPTGAATAAPPGASGVGGLY